MTNETFTQALLLGGGFVSVLWFFAFLSWLLSIILFFKVWGMTNDVKKMKDMLKEWLDLEHPLIDTDDDKAKDKKQS